MTKEEIKKVLDLALEYYKLEIFGTGKESQPPTQERIDYIYDRMQQSLPSDLDEAAQKVEDYYDVGEEHGYLYCHRGDIKDVFKAGAEWMAGQGISYDATISADKTIPVLPMKDVSNIGLDYGNNVTVQLWKK